MGEKMKLSHVYNKHGLSEYHKQDLCYPRTEVPAFMFWDSPDFDVDDLPEGQCPMRRWQDGRCALCGFIDRLVEDHDHNTGMTRGLVCQHCNMDEGHDHPRIGLWRKGLNVTGYLGMDRQYVNVFGKTPTRPEVSDSELDRIAAMLD